MKELLKRQLKLNKSEIRILLLLINNEKKFLSIKYIVKVLNLDRTTIQKRIKILKKFDFIEQKQLNLHRGFKYQYRLTSKLDLYNYLKNQIYLLAEKDFKVCDENLILDL